MLPEVTGVENSPDRPVVGTVLDALSTLLPVGIFAADANGLLWYASQRVCEAVGLSQEEAAAFVLSLHPEDLLTVAETWRVPAGRPSGQAKLRLVAPDRPVRSFEGQAIPLVDPAGEVQGYVGYLSGQAETERVALVTAQREENSRLQELDAVKAELLSAVSHELRTPLTSIVSFSELLAAGLGRDSVADQAEFLAIIGRNAKRLLRLVGDLLLLDRIDSTHGPVSEMTLVDLPKVVSDAVLGISPQAGERNIAVVTSATAGPALTGDAGRLGQLVDNLLSNAVKFTAPGGRIEVRTEPARGGWLVSVADNGIGIPAGEQELLFARFFRATNAHAQGTPGSGLGLSVAKAIVELHGGTISVSSREGSGTTFTVSLPAVPPAQAEAR